MFQSQRASVAPSFVLSPSAPEAWEMHTVTRTGAPPLRFKGREIASHSTGSKEPFFVTLWARKKGDFVIAYSDLRDGDVCPWAEAVDSPNAAADHLEARCQSDASTPLIDPQNLTFDGLIRALGHRQQFTQLVGIALADWDAQLDLSHPN